MPIGSVKSNLGHTEGASSLVSIVKALIALDSGVIPPNINFQSPNMKIEALKKETMKVILFKFNIIINSYQHPNDF